MALISILDTYFASYLLQDDEITVLLHIPDLENFLLVCTLIDLVSFNPILYRAIAKASSIIWFRRQVTQKPMMTKRASLGANCVSGISAKCDAKSPPPSSMSTPTGTKPPSPPSYQPYS